MPKNVWSYTLSESTEVASWLWLSSHDVRNIFSIKQENQDLQSRNVSLQTKCEALRILEEENQKMIKNLEKKIEDQTNDISFLQHQSDALLNNYWVIDVWPDGTIFDMNQNMEDISWYSFEEIKGKNMSIMSSWTHTREFWKAIFETIYAWFQWQGEIINAKKDGTLQWLETIIIPLFDKKGFRFFRVARRDISDIQERNKMLTTILNHEIDPTTKLPTLKQMYMDYATRLPKRLVIVRIDDMSWYNSEYGEDVGNRLTQKVAKVPKNYAQEFPEYGITIYKLRSNFTITYDTEVSDEFLRMRYARLQELEFKSFWSTYPDPNLTISPTFSFGIAVNELSIEAYYNNAQSALAANKDQSNRTTMYHESLDMRMLKKKNFELKKNITYAFNNDGFEIHFQPIIKVNHFGKMWALFWKFRKWLFPKNETHKYKYEVLVRMRNMDNPDKLIPPNDFLPVIEKDGRYQELTTRVIQKTCEFMLENPGQYSINLTADDINHPNRAREIHNQIIQYWISQTRFTIEILEWIQDISLSASDNLSYFRDQWFSIAIDDYGTWHSNLVRFVDIKAEFMKLDMSLIRWIDTNPNKELAVKSAVNLARSLGMQVVAEWVETEAEKQTLIDLSIDFMQGYLFGKPKNHI